LAARTSTGPRAMATPISTPSWPTLAAPGLIAFVGGNPFCDDLGTNHWGDTYYFPRPAGSNYWFIGTNGQFTASRWGKLWLGLNDDAISKLVNDNCGGVSGLVEIYAAP